MTIGFIYYQTHTNSSPLVGVIRCAKDGVILLLELPSVNICFDQKRGLPDAPQRLNWRDLVSCERLNPAPEPSNQVYYKNQFSHNTHWQQGLR